MIYFNENIKFILVFCLPYSIPYKTFFSQTSFRSLLAFSAKNFFQQKCLLEIPSILNKFLNIDGFFHKNIKFIPVFVFHILYHTYKQGQIGGIF